MTTWFYKDLGDAMMADEALNRIRESFLPVFRSAGNSEELAVFTRNDSEGRLHCEVFVYFSPAAAEVAQLFDALPCEKPLKDGLDLLAGDKSSWSLLFPEG